MLKLQCSFSNISEVIMIKCGVVTVVFGSLVVTKKYSYKLNNRDMGQVKKQIDRN